MLRSRKVQLAALAALFIAVYAYTFNPKWDLNGDNANYYILAKSILQGDGYSLISVPGQPPVNHYPPGYAALLAMLMAVIGAALTPLKVANGLLFLASAALLYEMAGRLVKSPPLVFAISALVLLNSKLYGVASILMSEIPYLFVTLLTFYLLMKWERDDYRLKSPGMAGFLLTLAAAYYLRSLGITLLAAVLLHLLMSRQWRPAAVALGGFIALNLPWAMRNAAHDLPSRYLGTIMTVNPWRPEAGTISSIGEFFGKMVKNFDDTVLKGFADVLFPFMNINFRVGSGAVGIIAGLALLAIVLFGAWQMGRWKYLWGGYILANIGVFMLWHGGNESRYVVPLIPVLALCFYFGLFELARIKITDPAMLSKLPFVLVLVGLASLGPLNRLAASSSQPYPPAYRNYFQIAATLKVNTPDDTIIACRKQGLFYVMSERQVVGYRYSLDDLEVIRGLVEDNVNYVILDQLGYSSTYRYLLPAVQKHPTLFTNRLSLPKPDTYLLQFQRNKAISTLSASEIGK